MASKQELPNSNKVVSGSLHSSTNNEETPGFNASGSGCSASDLNTSDQHENAVLDDEIEYRDTMMIHNILNENQLNSVLSHYLLKLEDYEIVFVCDDSTSMRKKVNGTDTTRWQELCTTVKKLLPITMAFDTNGVDIHFLNRRSYPRVKSAAVIDRAFSNTPRGYTLLVPILTKIFQSSEARREREKKLLVFIATDGKPTDERGKDVVDELERLMRNVRDAETTFVSFLLCTDERKCVDYMAKWDREMIHVDVTDDYDTEREKIRRCQENPNYSFTYDDYIVKALVGSIIPHIDRLNEPRT